MQTQGMLTVEELAELAHTGQIDTVLWQFTDLQGRFMGKRVLPRLLPRGRARRRGPARVPVPARDRHGDGAAPRLRLRELGHGVRRLPDGPRHRDAAADARGSRRPRMVICDIADEETSEPIAVAPRAILERQIGGRRRAGLPDQDRVRARVLPVQGLVRRDGRPRVPGPAAAARATSWTTTCCRPRRTSGSSGRSATTWRRRHPRRVLARASSARASTRSTSRTPTRCPTPTITPSTSTASRRSPR